MTCPPLAIVQARIGSRRFPGKMLADLGGKPLVWWAWKASVDAFGAEDVVVAIPGSAENDELAAVVEGFGGTVFRWDGPENDVLGRFYACAHRYRWHPEAVIARVTPDDPRKSPVALQLSARGCRMPVEQGGEAFTLAMLDEAARRECGEMAREHITWALFGSEPPPPPAPGPWTVDTPEDLEAMRKLPEFWAPAMLAKPPATGFKALHGKSA